MREKTDENRNRAQQKKQKTKAKKCKSLAAPHWPLFSQLERRTLNTVLPLIRYLCSTFIVAFTLIKSQIISCSAQSTTSGYGSETGKHTYSTVLGQSRDNRWSAGTWKFHSNCSMAGCLTVTLNRMLRMHMDGMYSSFNRRTVGPTGPMDRTRFPNGNLAQIQ